MIWQVSQNQHKYGNARSISLSHADLIDRDVFAIETALSVSNTVVRPAVQQFKKKSLIRLRTKLVLIKRKTNFQLSSSVC